MTHSTVLVLTRPGQTVEEALAPFDENITVEPYIDSTKADLIKNERERQARAAEQLKEFLADPANYPGLRNPNHLDWIVKRAPIEAALSDEELFEQVIKTKSYLDLDENGNEWSTYSPKSRWDWYTIGGRWDLGLRDSRAGVGAQGQNILSLANLDLDATPVTYAILTPDGEWHERGKLGWFAMASNEQAEDAWSATWREILAAIPNPNEVTVTLVDVHI